MPAPIEGEYESPCKHDPTDQGGNKGHRGDEMDHDTHGEAGRNQRAPAEDVEPDGLESTQCSVGERILW